MASLCLAASKVGGRGAGCNGLIFWAAQDSLLTPTLPPAVHAQTPRTALACVSTAKVKSTPVSLPPLPLSARRAGTVAELHEGHWPGHLPVQLPRSEPASSRAGSERRRRRQVHSAAGAADAFHLVAECPLAECPSVGMRRRPRPFIDSRRRSARGRRCYEGAPCLVSRSIEQPVGMPRAPRSEADVFDPTLDRRAVLRADVAEGLAEKEAQDLALAHRRRSASKSASERSRERARKNSARAKQGSRESRGQQPSDLAAEAFNHLLFDSLAEHPDENAPRSTASRAASRESVDVEDLTGVTKPSISGQRRTTSILDNLKLKTPLERRLIHLSVFCEKGRKKCRRQSRLRSLLELRRKEFEKRPEEERKQLTEIFARYDSDGSGALEPHELVNCLQSLGLVAKTEVELRELKRIGDEVSLLGAVDFLQFSLELVPRARQKLQELRHGHLYLEFKMYDEDDSGFLDERECTQILERLCTSNLDTQGMKEMEQAFQELIQQVSDEAGQISFEAFQELVASAREIHRRIETERVAEICLKEGVSEADACLHPGELVTLCDAYRRSAGGESAGARGRTWDETRMVLIEYGLLPRDQEAQMDVFFTFGAVDENCDGHINLTEVLKLVRQLRAKRRESEEPSMMAMFHRFDRNQDANIDMAELSVVLEELGVQPFSWEDQMEMRCLLDEVDTDRSGDLSFREFTELVERLRERLAMAARRRQRVAASTLYFADHQVAELRDVFFNLDTEQDGFLLPEQLRRALDILRIPIRAEDLRKLIDDVDVHNGDLVDFEGFLRFFRAVVPVDEGKDR